jgi:hypothetical protein
MPRERATPAELVGASEEPIVLVGEPSSVQVTVPADSRDRFHDASRGGQRLFVSVENIEAERDPGLVYAVFLTSSNGGDAPTTRHHIGNVSFFGVQESADPDLPHGGGARGLAHTFDATDAVNALREQQLGDSLAITVTFEPVGILPPPGQEETWEPEPLSEFAKTPVTIGRVSLFVA